jgi:hypothetical protein
MKKLVRFDWAIKHLLRNKANFDVLEGFLSELMHEPEIKIETVLESEGNKQTENDKFNRVDVLVKTQRKLVMGDFLAATILLRLLMRLRRCLWLLNHHPALKPAADANDSARMLRARMSHAARA